MSEHQTRRLLILSYEYPPVGGGTGKAARNIARQFVRAGFDVTVATSRFENLAREECHERLRIFRLPVLRRELNYAHAIEVLSCVPSGMLAAKRLVRAARPEMVIAFMTIPGAAVAWWIKSSFGVPYLCLLRGQDVPGYPETPAWMHTAALPVTRLLWRGAERVFANSESLAQLARTSAQGIRIDVAPNGVDTELYAPAVHCPALPSRPARILYTGRLVRKKRVRELIRAVALLGRRHLPPFELKVVGFGPERTPLERLAENLGIASRVKFTGRLNEPELIEALQTADIFVNGSEGEGLPNAVLEAMACGLPVVLSDIGPHRELIHDTVEGRLCDGGSPEALAEALAPLLESGLLRARMGTAARYRVLENFSWERSARSLIQCVDAARERNGTLE